MFDFRSTAGKIEGWLTEAEGVSLYEAARRVPQGLAIVEVGSWKGRSAVCLASGARDGAGMKVVAVDPHTGSSEHRRMFGEVDTFGEFRAHVARAGLSAFVEPIRQTSAEAARGFPERVGFVFIDGAHEREFVQLDLDSWFPKVADGGMLAFHDSWHFPGPNRTTARFLATSSRVRRPRLVDTITYMEKVDRNTIFERVRNIAFLFYRTLVGWKGFLKLKYGT